MKKCFISILVGLFSASAMAASSNGEESVKNIKPTCYLLNTLNGKLERKSCNISENADWGVNQKGQVLCYPTEFKNLSNYTVLPIGRQHCKTPIKAEWGKNARGQVMCYPAGFDVPVLPIAKKNCSAFVKE